VDAQGETGKSAGNFKIVRENWRGGVAEVIRVGQRPIFDRASRGFCHYDIHRALI